MDFLPFFNHSIVFYFSESFPQVWEVLFTFWRARFGFSPGLRILLWLSLVCWFWFSLFSFVFDLVSCNVRVMEEASSVFLLVVLFGHP